MIQHRARAARHQVPGIGNHTLRATGITAYLKNEGELEHALAFRIFVVRGDGLARDSTDCVRFGSCAFPKTC